MSSLPTVLSIEISVVVAVAFVLLLLYGAKFAVHLLKMHSNPHVPNEGDGMWQDSTLVAEGQLSLREAVLPSGGEELLPSSKATLVTSYSTDIA